LHSPDADVFSDPLFDLLLDLATSHGPESDAANDGSHLTAVACACLLSLVVVRGDTGKLLSATAALLMCPRALASQNIHVRLDSRNLDLFLHSYSCFMFWLLFSKGALLGRPKKSAEVAKSLFMSYELTAGQKCTLNVADIANSVELCCL